MCPARTVNMAIQWMRQTNSGTFRTWEDLKFVRDNWDGPLVIKGIMSLKVRRRPVLPPSPLTLCRTPSWP